MVVVELERQGPLLFIKLGLGAWPAGPGSRSRELLLLHEVALELGQGRPEGAEHELAHDGGSVDVVVEAAKADASALEVLDRFEEMAQVSTEPIESPDDEDAALAQPLERPLQLGAFHCGRVRHVDEELVDARPVEGLFLEVEALASRRDAGVSDKLGQSVPLQCRCADRRA